MDIIYDGRKDPIYNDLVLTLQECVYYATNSRRNFIDIIQIIDYGQIMIIVCKKDTVVFDKISRKAMNCVEMYLYSIMYNDYIYEWYSNNNKLCRYVSHKDSIDIVDHPEGDLKVPLLDPVSMFFVDYHNTKDIDLHNVNYGIDLMDIYKSRGIKMSDNYVDLLIVIVDAE